MVEIFRNLLIDFFLIFSMVSGILNSRHKNKNFQLLRDFTCAAARDELEKHPEMRTIAMIELENNFPPNFCREILKCLPDDVTKIVMNFQVDDFENKIIFMPKESIIIYVVDNPVSM
jgi:hypothetical protein